jgi:hypothetical protein
MIATALVAAAGKAKQFANGRQLAASLGLPNGINSVRASANFYPDPLSSLILSPEIDTDQTPYAQFTASTNAYLVNPH